MTKYILIAFLSCMALFSYTQDVIENSSMNKMITDTIDNEEIFIGECTYDSVQSKTFYAEMHDFHYNEYKADSIVLDSLSKLIEPIEIVLIMGSWCGDSQEQVPRFYRIIKEIGYSPYEIKLICVDRNKKGGDYDVTSFQADKVPTFIFYKNSKEIGRIIETPKVSLEADMLSIIQEEK